jgi:hypothetical protein
MMVTMTRSSLETRPAFGVGPLEFSWGDVTAAARRRGEWAPLEQEARRTLGRAGRMARDRVDAAARDFRRERGLSSRDDLEGWLAHWGLSQTEWLDFIRRSLVQDSVDAEAEGPPDEQAVAAAAAVDAACSGCLVRFARRLAGDAALAAERGFVGKDLDRVAAFGERGRAEAVTAEAIEHELLTHELAWTRLDWQLLHLPDADTAMEAAMCIRVDGSSVTQVAEAAGIAPVPHSTLLEDAGASLRPYFEAAVPNDLIGPLAVEDGFALIVVEDRRSPDPADRELRARAEPVVAERAVQRALHKWVEWKDPALR